MERVKLRKRSRRNLRGWTHLVVRETGVGPNGTESLGGDSERTKGLRSITLQKTTKKRAGFRRAETFGPTKRRRSTVDLEESVDSGAAENVVQKSMFPDVSTEEAEISKNGKGFKGPRGEHIKNYGQQVMRVRTPDGFLRKSTWLVADVRGPLVSASHIIQAGSDLFMEKSEAFIMNRAKKETSVLRKEGNVYVLDLLVTVSSVPLRQSSTSPWKLTQSSKLQTEGNEGSR